MSNKQNDIWNENTEELRPMTKGEYEQYEDTQENLKKLIDSFMPEVLRVATTCEKITKKSIHERNRYYL